MVCRMYLSDSRHVDEGTPVAKKERVRSHERRVCVGNSLLFGDEIKLYSSSRRRHWESLRDGE